MVNTIAQILGYIAMGLNLIIYSRNKRKSIITFLMISACFFTVHYFLLGAYTGSALNLICVLRSAVFLNNDKKWAKSKFWLWFFIAVCALSGVLTFKAWYSILPPIGMILSTISNWMKSETKIRLITLPSSPCWLIYNIINHSVAGIITECIVMTSLLISIIRFDILKTDKKKSLIEGDSTDESQSCL